MLAAVLANALYGAAVGFGDAGRGPHAGGGRWQRGASLARSQVLKAGRAADPGVMDIRHWQAAQVAGPVRAWAREPDLGPWATHRRLGIRVDR